MTEDKVDVVESGT